MAARRVVAVSSNINGLTCPTGKGSAIDYKAENRGLSNRKRPPSFSDFAAPAHKGMSRTLGYCLTLGTPDAWCSFAQIAAARLTVGERGAIAAAALRSLPAELVEEIAAAVIGAIGDPLPAFLGGMEDARHWSRFASRTECKAYALAAFEALPRQDREAFRRHISGQGVAA